MSTDDVRRIGAPRSLQSRRHAGELHRIRRDAYIDRETWAALDPAGRHLARMRAVAASARTEPLFSHESAAIAWGIPLVGVSLARVHVEVPAESAARSRGDVVRHRREHRHGASQRARGLRVTSRIETLLDLAADRPHPVAVVAADHLLAAAPDPDALRAVILEEIEGRRPFRGARPAEAALRQATGLAESPLESLCMVRFAELGITMPEQQVEFLLDDGERGRVDFFWRREGVVLEADGWRKLEDPELLAGRMPAEALRDEKRREDAIRRRCRTFVRVEWDDVWHGHGLRRKLENTGLI
ncbi:hypothetical protein [Homoserinibacter sp. YIM 151385]|uniref:hypothetical protein n=1 Tax=Homoserinibacter sp. YIM 151385 TaxID=2985506 RepID=UPI0022EFE1A3|nr:hypothetical protein [Homoserinibacter sp. YIM 151385]WBU37676.1 hypothetical protein OF852_12250 [Homoserinibacter sp. YIM 151385]